jgi:hypothetical protein
MALTSAAVATTIRSRQATATGGPSQSVNPAQDLGE